MSETVAAPGIKVGIPDEAAAVLAEQFSKERFDFFEQMGAVFSRYSSISGVFELMRSGRNSFEPEEGFDPVPLLSGEELSNPEIARVLAGARSREELDFLRRRRGELRELERAIGSGPLHPLVAGFIGGVLDPINLVPLGWAARIGMAARGAGVLAQGVTQGAAIGLAGSVLMEPFQQVIDPFRGLSDTLVDLAAGTAFGSAFGAAGVGLAALRSGRRNALLNPSERTADNDPLVRGMTREGLPPELAAEASHEMRAALARALNETAPGRAAEDGDTSAGAARVIDNARITRDVLRERLLDPDLGLLGRVFTRAVTQFGAYRVPGLELATSPFRTAREFVYSYDDPGPITAAIARQMSDADIRALYAEAQKRGLQLTEDEFVAQARNELAAGLAVTERGNFEARRALLHTAYERLADSINRISAEAVRDGLVKNSEEFDKLAATWARYRQEPHRYTMPPVTDANLVKALERALGEWRSLVAKPFLERIRASGLWDTYGQDGRSNPLRDLDAEYFPKQLDVRRIAERPNEFAETMFNQIRDAASAAKARVDAYDTAVEAAKNIREVTNKAIAGLRKAGYGDLAERLRQYRAAFDLANRAVHKAEEELIKHAKIGSRRTLQQWLDEIAGREAGIRPGRVTDVDRALIADYEAALARRAEAEADYAIFAQMRGNGIKQVTGVDIPQAMIGRPKRPPSYERDRLLAYGDGVEPGLAGRDDLIRERAREITAGLLAGTDPHLKMDYGLRSSLKAREVDLNPVAFEPYFKDSFLQNAEAYVSIISREVAAMEKFGTVKADDVIARLTNEYMEMRRNITDAKKLEDLQQRFETEVSLIRELMAEARGVRNQATSKNQRKFQEFGSNVLSINYMLQMGSGLLAQIGDITKAVMAYGLMPFVKHGMKSLIAGITGAFDGIPKENLAKLATGVEWVNLNRERALYDIAPPEHQSKTTQAITKLTNLSSRLYLMSLWNDWLRRTGLRITDDMLIRGLEDLRAGREPPREFRVIVAKAGVGEDMLRRIGAQIERHRTEFKGSGAGSPLYDSNMEMWFSRDAEAFEAYRLLLHTGGQQALVQPGPLDTPLWTQNTLGRLAFQFKRFAMASIPQILIPFLQMPAGKQFVVGLTALAAGATSTVLRDLNTKGEIKDRTVLGWLLDSLDMSGLASGLTEADATISALTKGRGLKRLLTGEDYTRWQERQRIEGLLGPSVRTLRNLNEAMWLPYDALHPDERVAEHQITAVRRLIPIFNTNLFLRHPTDMLEAELGGRQRGTSGVAIRDAIFDR